CSDRQQPGTHPPRNPRRRRGGTRALGGCAHRRRRRWLHRQRAGTDPRPARGPGSAGAVPGPAAYDRGGELATVTDANVVLGYLPAVQKLGGDFQVRHDLATAAVQRVADAMGVSLFEAAEGIVRLA